MKTFQITEEQAQRILNYIVSIPTGAMPLKEGVELVNILMNLQEDGRVQPVPGRTIKRKA
jgi:hypothetical protein